MTWEEGLAFASARGKRLPRQAEVAADLRATPIVTHDLWIPVLDARNEWVSVGNRIDRLGRTHTQAIGAPPTWSVNHDHPHVRTHIALADY